jgi:hypothetical protein
MREGTVWQAEQGDHTLRIVQDFDPEDPRKWSNLGTMAVFSARYRLGDDHNYADGRDLLEGLAAEYWQGVTPVEDLDIDRLTAIVNRHYLIMPLYLHDHGYVSMSAGTVGDTDDGEAVGYYYVALEDVRREWGGRLTAKRRAAAIRCLAGEVHTYNLYLEGDVYGFELVRRCQCPTCNTEHEEHIDSCWGFYGENIAEMAANIRGYLPAEHGALINQLEAVR